MRIGNIFEWKSPNGGLPKDTNLELTLIIIATINLLCSWNLRIKFVDDTTAFEIIPRNSASLLNFAINDVYTFGGAQNEIESDQMSGDDS